MNETERATFRERGYVIARRLLPADLIERVMQTMHSLLCTFDAEFNAVPASALIDNARFHTLLVSFRKAKPRQFGAMYDAMQTTVVMHELFSNPRLVERAAGLLQPGAKLSLIQHVLRMDVPHDTRNNLDWHQDFLINRVEHDCRDGITAWIPLQHVDERNGSVKVCPASHHERVKTIPAPRPRDTDYGSEAHTIPPEVLGRYQPISVEADAGDVVFLSMNLIHRSGENRSENVRLTAQGIYFDFTSVDFVPGRPQFKPSLPA